METAAAVAAAAAAHPQPESVSSSSSSPQKEQPRPNQLGIRNSPVVTPSPVAPPRGFTPTAVESEFIYLNNLRKDQPSSPSQNKIINSKPDKKDEESSAASVAGVRVVRIWDKVQNIETKEEFALAKSLEDDDNSRELEKLDENKIVEGQARTSESDEKREAARNRQEAWIDHDLNRREEEGESVRSQPEKPAEQVEVAAQVPKFQVGSPAVSPHVLERNHLIDENVVRIHF